MRSIRDEGVISLSSHLAGEAGSTEGGREGEGRKDGQDKNLISSSSRGERRRAKGIGHDQGIRSAAAQTTTCDLLLQDTPFAFVRRMYLSRKARTEEGGREEGREGKTHDYNVTCPLGGTPPPAPPPLARPEILENKLSVLLLPLLF